MVLQDSSTQTQAVVKVDAREKEISIFVNGEQKRDFFAVIRKRFNEINSKFKEIEIDELIPLPEFPKFKVKYKELIGYEKAGRDEYFNGELGKVFSVSKLLNGIERPENRESANIHNHFYKESTVGNNTMTINGGNTGIANIGNNNTINQTITTTNNDLKDLLEKLQVEANKVVEALPTEEAKESFKDDIATFMEKTQENKLDKYFKVSKDGLLEATEAVGEVGIKAMGYIKQIVGLLG